MQEKLARQSARYWLNWWQMPLRRTLIPAVNCITTRSVSLLLFLATMAGSADAMSSECASEITPGEKRTKSLIVNAAGIGAVTVWGVSQWDYFSRKPHAESEGWFSNDTDHGGADKLGHFYTSYATSHGLSYLYERWCFDKDDAALYGALSSLAIWGYMELGDAFSSYGASYEDLVMNTLGSFAGYYLYKHPDLARKLDLRWEYGFHPNDRDFVTDYENSKFLLALKFNGFQSMRHSFLKHLELHLGYYTRGFEDPDADKERNIYLGLGINLTDLFRRRGYAKTATALNYVQLPATYLKFEKDLN